MEAKTSASIQSAAMKRMLEIADRLYANSPKLFEEVKTQSYLLSKIGPKGEAGAATVHLPSIHGGEKHPAPKLQEKTPKNIHEEFEQVNSQYESEKVRADKLRDLKKLNMNNYITKEQEYREKIEEYTKKIKPMELTAQNRANMERFESDHKRILAMISDVQIRTSNVLIQQEEDIIMFYNEKINELTKQFKEENTRQKERHASFKKKEEKLMSELEWIKKIAHKIDIENYYLMKRYTELKVEHETQANDLKLLGEESQLQTKRSEDLENKVQEYKTLLQRLIKDKDLEGDLDLDALTDSKIIENLRKSQNKGEGKEARSLLIDDVSRDNPSVEVDEAIRRLKNAIHEEREKILMLKHRYTAKMDEKSEMEKILRQCIADYKDELWEIKGKIRTADTNQAAGLEQRLRGDIKDIIEQEKKLTLLYDRMFHLKPLQKHTERMGG